MPELRLRSRMPFPSRPPVHRERRSIRPAAAAASRGSFASSHRLGALARRARRRGARRNRPGARRRLSLPLLDRARSDLAGDARGDGPRGRRRLLALAEGKLRERYARDGRRAGRRGLRDPLRVALGGPRALRPDRRPGRLRGDGLRHRSVYVALRPPLLAPDGVARPRRRLRDSAPRRQRIRPPDRPLRVPAAARPGAPRARAAARVAGARARVARRDDALPDRLDRLADGLRRGVARARHPRRLRGGSTPRSVGHAGARASTPPRRPPRCSSRSRSRSTSARR